MSRTTISALLLSLAALAHAESPAPTTSPDVTPKTVFVTKGSLHPELAVTGYLQAIDPQIVKLSPKGYAGKFEILEVVASGTTVHAGQVVLKLKDDDYKKALISAENELKNAQAALGKTKVDNEISVKADALALEEAQRSLKVAQDTLSWWDKVDGPQMLKSYELDLKNANDRVEDQSDELNQLKKMYASEDLTNATSDIVVKRAVRSFDESKVMLQMTKERLERSKAIDYANARQPVADAVPKAEHALALLQASQAQAAVQRETTLSAAQLAVQSTQEKLDDLKADASLFETKAAKDGVVLWGKLATGAWSDNAPDALKAGEETKPGQELMMIYAPTSLRVVASLDEHQVLRVLPGQSAEVTPIALPEARTTGQIESVALTSSADHYDASLSLSKIDARLRPGMKVNVHCTLQEVPDAVVIPTGAIKDGKVKVWKDGKSQPREVTVGQSDPENTQVIDGLKAGEEIEAGE